MSFTWLVCSRIQVGLVVAALVAALLGGAGQAQATDLDVTTVQPYVGVWYVKSWQGATPGITVYQFLLRNAGATDAKSVAIDEEYSYGFPGPCCVRAVTATVVPNVPARGSALFELICHAPNGATCKSGYAVISPGNYLMDANHRDAHSW
jgi:hypothetical protein